MKKISTLLFIHNSTSTPETCLIDLAKEDEELEAFMTGIEPHKAPEKATESILEYLDQS